MDSRPRGGTRAAGKERVGRFVSVARSPQAHVAPSGVAGDLSRSQDGCNSVPHFATSWSTDRSTGSSPQPAIPFSLSQQRIPPITATFRWLPLLAGVPAGLLIPRSQVRSLPGPLRNPCKQAIHLSRNSVTTTPGQLPVVDPSERAREGPNQRE